MATLDQPKLSKDTERIAVANKNAVQTVCEEGSLECTYWRIMSPQTPHLKNTIRKTSRHRFLSSTLNIVFSVHSLFGVTQCYLE